MAISFMGEEVSFKGDTGSGGQSGSTKGCVKFPHGKNGQVALGGDGGSILEINVDSDGGGIWLDVSYILGYSVPVVCHANGAMTGCNEDLFNNGGKEGSVKKNPRGPNFGPYGTQGSEDPGQYDGSKAADSIPWCYACSPPPDFFGPCAGAAYTFPYDDKATIKLPDGKAECCIGANCPKAPKQGSTWKTGYPQTAEQRGGAPCQICPSSGKRSMDELETVFKRFEEEGKVVGEKLIPRRHKRHTHRHAAAHGSLNE